MATSSFRRQRQGLSLPRKLSTSPCTIWRYVHGLPVTGSSKRSSQPVQAYFDATGCGGKENCHGEDGGRFVVVGQVRPTTGQTLYAADLVGQVVGPAAIGVDVIEVLPQAPGQQARGDVEVFVVMGGQPARVVLRFGHRTAEWRQRAGYFQFFG